MRSDCPSRTVGTPPRPAETSVGGQVRGPKRNVERRDQPIEIADVHRGQKPGLVPEVVVDEATRHAGGLADLFEGDLADVALGQHTRYTLRICWRRTSGSTTRLRAGVYAARGVRSLLGEPGGRRLLGGVQREVACDVVTETDLAHLGLDLRAHVLGAVATSTEAATAGRRHGRRDLAAERRLLTPAAPSDRPPGSK